MKLYLCHLKTSQMFWCNFEKGYIYPTRNKIRQTERKTISISPAIAFNARKQLFFPHSIQWIHNFIFNVTTSSATSQNIFYLHCMKMFNQFKPIKSPKSSYLAIYLLSLNRSAHCDAVLLINHWWHCVGHSLQHLFS